MNARCKNGGPAPCIDDLCHNTAQTLCGIPAEWLHEDEEDDWPLDDEEDDWSPR